MTDGGATGKTRTSGKGATAIAGGGVGAVATGVGAGLAGEGTGGVEKMLRHSGMGVDAQPATNAAVPRLTAAVRRMAWLRFLNRLECLELGISDFLWQWRSVNLSQAHRVAPEHETHITRRAGFGGFAFLGK